MNPKPATALDVSPEEEAFLQSTFRRLARSYLGISVFALGLAIAGLGFGLRNASASGGDTTALHESQDAQREQIEAIRLEIATQLDASAVLSQRLTALEEQLVGFEADPSALGGQLDDAYRRIHSLERKQGITSPVSPSLYKRLNRLEARLSVVELER